MVLSSVNAISWHPQSHVRVLQCSKLDGLVYLLNLTWILNPIFHFHSIISQAQNKFPSNYMRPLLCHMEAEDPIPISRLIYHTLKWHEPQHLNFIAWKFGLPSSQRSRSIIWHSHHSKTFGSALSFCLPLLRIHRISMDSSIEKAKYMMEDMEEKTNDVMDIREDQ